MRYKAEYDEYSETNKFLDELFQEDCELDWACNQSQNCTDTAQNIVTVYSKNSAEESYVNSLAQEMGEKITKIIDKASNLPEERDRNIYLTKEDLISRLINISNSLDSLLNEIEEVTDNNFTTTIINGTLPIGPKMF